MDPATLTVIFKGVGMLLAILGGVIIAYLGFCLYKDGAGTGRDFAAFTVGPIKVKAHSVGSIMMGTAFLWAWAGVLLSPNMEKKDGQIRVYSFSTPEIQAKAESIQTVVHVSDTSIKYDPEQLKKLLKGALTKFVADPHKTPLEINGQPAKFVPDSIRTTKSDSGKYMFETKAKSESTWVDVTFEPMVAHGRLLFAPVGVKKTTVSGQEPNQPVQQTP